MKTAFYQWPLKQQLNEIESLVQEGFYKDAVRIANWTYVGERDRAPNGRLTQEADNLLYLICGRIIRHYDSKNSTPEAIKLLRTMDASHPGT